MLTIDLTGPTLANSNIKQMQSWQVANPSCKSIEEQSHQISRQRNQAQRQWSETYEK